MKYIDIHTHQQYDDTDVTAIWNRLFDTTDPHILPTHSYSVHPWYLDNNDWENMESAIAKAQENSCVAIGECGLDKVTNTPWSSQIKAFEKQIHLANIVKKPIINHCVRAFQECISLLKNNEQKVIFHGINSSYRKIEPILNNGYYISVGKSLLQYNSTINTLIHDIPIHQLFLETDNASIHIKEIYAALATILKIEEEQLILQFINNFNSLFK